MNGFSYNGLHWRVRVKESSALNVRPGDVSGVTGLDRDRLIYFDPSWRAVAERVDLTSDGDYIDETADTLWGLTYIDEAIASWRTGGGGSIDKADVLYHLYDAQYSVVGRVLDDGDAMPRLVERIVYSVYGEPTAYPYSYADCADVNGNPGPDGQLTNEDDVQFSAWYSGGDVRADIADDFAVVPMDLANNSGVTSDDLTAFSVEYWGGGLWGIGPVAGAVSQPRTMWSGGNGPTGTSADTAISDIGYCGYAWNPGSGQYAVRFRNYDPELGRWLQRDPAGYVDGMGVYSYGRTKPAMTSDPLGLWESGGHYWTVYLAARCALARTPNAVERAMTLAYYSQYPDQVEEYDAYSIWKKRHSKPLFVYAELESDFIEEEAYHKDIFNWVHSLHGGGSNEVAKRQECLRKMIESKSLPPWEVGILLHAFGDAYAHVDNEGNAYGWPDGHGADSANSKLLGLNSCPDCVGNRPERYSKYFRSLCQALGGSMTACEECAQQAEKKLHWIRSEVDRSHDQRFGTDGEFKDEFVSQMQKLARERGFPADGYVPTDSHNVSASRRAVSRSMMQSLIDKIKKCCEKSE